MENSLKEVIEEALRDASKAHRTLIEEMTHENAPVDVIEHENTNWEPFYAEFVAKRLTPTAGEHQGRVDRLPGPRNQTTNCSSSHQR